MNVQMNLWFAAALFAGLMPVRGADESQPPATMNLTLTSTVFAEGQAIPAKYTCQGNDSSPAERASLIVLANLETLQVRALPKDLPDALEYDAEKLVAVGDHVTVADLIIPAGVEVVTAAEQTIATVYEPSALQAANDAAGGTADEDDAQTVESGHESGAEEGTQKDEIRPGSKEEKEDKSQGRNSEKQ